MSKAQAVQVTPPGVQISIASSASCCSEPVSGQEPMNTVQEEKWVRLAQV